MKDKLSKKHWLVGSILLASAIMVGFSGLSAYEKHHEKSEHDEQKWSSLPTAETVSSTLYKEECGSCHLAYPAGLLPKKSWYAIMKQLDQHFGDNAELDDKTAKEISQYLINQSTSNNRTHSMKKLLRKLSGKTPLRITELPYFVHEHDEIPKRMSINNPRVKSLSQCDACHKNAIKGDFDEDRVVIPGFGSWDD